MTAQALTALAEAQAVRRKRAAIKRRLAATRPRAAAIGAGLTVLAGPAPRLAGMAVRDLLVSLYGIGHIRAAHVLDVTGVDPATTLADVSVDERRRLTRALAGLVGPQPRQTGGRRQATVARQDGAPAARDGAGDSPAPGGTPTTRSRHAR
jgi:hypothetical protein